MNFIVVKNTNEQGREKATCSELTKHISKMNVVFSGDEDSFFMWLFKKGYSADEANKMIKGIKENPFNAFTAV